MRWQNTSQFKIKSKNAIFLSIGILILIIITVGYLQNWRKNHQINQEINSLNQEITDLERNNLETKKLIEYFNSDAYIEEKARIDLGLKKEGEKVVVAHNQALTEKDTSTQKNDSEKQNEPPTIPQKWWFYFFK
jgi:cell division protein FtsB